MGVSIIREVQICHGRQGLDSALLKKSVKKKKKIVKLERICPYEEMFKKFLYF